MNILVHNRIMRMCGILSVIFAAMILTGCPATLTQVPDKIPKPQVNPELLISCPEDLSQLDLTNGFNFSAVLEGRKADSLQYRLCACRYEKTRLLLCAITETKCAPELPMCKGLVPESANPFFKFLDKEKPK